jgi:hypothetical protein
MRPFPAYGAPEPSLATFTIVTTNNAIFTIMILIGGSFIMINEESSEKRKNAHKPLCFVGSLIAPLFDS